MANERGKTENGVGPAAPPRGLAILAIVGPSMVWAAEYIGSGEVILAPRAGAILGIGILWIVIATVFLKFLIGMCGARYTVCTGEGMIDMFDRIPGPRHWAVWVVLVVQFVAGAVSTGALASASGSFVSDLLGIDRSSALNLFGASVTLRSLCGWAVAIFALSIAWMGEFRILKVVMTALVLIMVLSVMLIAVRVFPPASEFLRSFSFSIPSVPDWAAAQSGVSDSWKIVLPLLGWSAGGFASQVWYSYWVIGANYGMAEGRGYGRPADVNILKNLGQSAAEKIKGWCRVVYADATLALVIGIVVTSSFLVAGAGVLRPLQQVPDKEKVAETLSQLLSWKWGAVGRTLYLLAG
ncbi:Nramp family divalent metal transporter, partial [Candidatus Sumerlaeota bacterium]|nr:Nramp family divalent metal transporter [Candidatus Sumerlaeota bacterium]